VDDEPDEQRALAIAIGPDVNTRVIHPNDVVVDDLETNLILVDFRLPDWPERDALESVALKPMNGLALAAVLRVHADERKRGRPTAIALHSAHIPDIAPGLPPEYREHAIARANNLEWVFQKVQVDPQTSIAKRAVSLASAVAALPDVWPKDDADDTQRIVNKLLDVVGRAWERRAWEDIQACHPPIHDLSQPSHGLAFLRWFLHRIIPYPCFLWDNVWLAARLRVTPASLTAALAENSKVTDVLAEVRYTGILQDFHGDRWWRSGVEALIWRLTDGNAFEPDAIREALADSSGATLEAVPQAQPYVCIDERYQAMQDFSDASAVVEVQPDDWPPYADQAWTTIELAQSNDAVGALVIEQDRHKLS